MSCIAAYTDPGSVYPVIDPLRFVAGPLPQHYAYYFAWDTVGITVEDDPTFNFSACSIRVVLTSAPGVTWAKSIVGWNYFTNAAVGGVQTSGSDHGPHEMIVQRGMCGTGAHTLLLRKAMAFNVMTGLYTLKSDDLWTYWGGKKVTFSWASDQSGSGVWGSNTPTPTYPVGRFSVPVESAAEPGIFYLDVGGGMFRIGNANELEGFGFSPGETTQQAIVVPPAPVDFTLIKDQVDPHIYVCFGGAKFWFPDMAELSAFGLSLNQVNQVPAGTLVGVSDMPRDGTLLRERRHPEVFLAMGGKLHWITSLSVFDRMCLSWRNVRVVPRDGLSALPRGSDLF